MPINRKLWIQYFVQNKLPTWTCSKCNVGLLEIQKGTFSFEETGESKLAHGHDAWEPEWINYRFVALLKCNNKHCIDIVTLAGRGEEKETYYDNCGHTEQEYLKVFYPEYFCPPPRIFPIPEKTPENIKNEIMHSFRIFLTDQNAAGNRIRTCVEMILNQQKIIKTKLSKKRTRENITLHTRIKEFEKKHKELGENLLAIKWLGNAASHSSGLNVNDIFDAYSILHHVLNEIYDSRSKRIKKLTKDINKKKGKLSK